jgi:hypothetical protein
MKAEIFSPIQRIVKDFNCPSLADYASQCTTVQAFWDSLAEPFLMLDMLEGLGLYACPDKRKESHRVHARSIYKRACSEAEWAHTARQRGCPISRETYPERRLSRERCDHLKAVAAVRYDRMCSEAPRKLTQADVSLFEIQKKAWALMPRHGFMSSADAARFAEQIRSVVSGAEVERIAMQVYGG